MEGRARVEREEQAERRAAPGVPAAARAARWPRGQPASGTPAARPEPATPVPAPPTPALLMGRRRMRVRTRHRVPLALPARPATRAISAGVPARRTAP